GPLDLGVKAGRDRRSLSSIAAGTQCNFAEEAHFWGERRYQMQRELPLTKATMCAFLVRPRKVEIRKASKFQRRILRLSRGGGLCSCLGRGHIVRCRIARCRIARCRA